MSLMSAFDGSPPGAGAVLTQACENCRRRKVKCNRQDPCSNCLTSNLDCRPAKRHIEHRPRVVLSSNYQRSIDQINDRLVSIEQLVKNLSLNEGSLFPGGVIKPHGAQREREKPNTPINKAASPDEHDRSAQTPAPPSFEGDSSFATQSVLAGELASLSAVQGQQSLEILDALSSLKDLMNTTTPDGASTGFDDVWFDPSERPKSLPDMELLPANFIIALLRKLREYPSMHYLAYSLRDHMSLERICRAVYFPTEPVTLGLVTTMHGFLLFLLQEYLAINDPLLKGWDAIKFSQICEKNLHIGCQSYELMAVASFDNITALFLGTVVAQLSSLPLLSWTLCSAAARHCHTLGYHRERSLRGDTHKVAEEKRHIFWSLYSMDKNLALNLGRASNFQDIDIDTKFFEISKEPSIAAWDRATIWFIVLSKYQGQVFDRLYSASALTKSKAERMEIIAEIDCSLSPWLTEWAEISSNCRDAYFAEYFDLFYGASDIIYYSVMTTLHRAASMNEGTTEITAKCFEAATAGLRNHLQFLPVFTRGAGANQVDSYVAWILLYTCFTPLIVVFLHSIASNSLEDVKLLHDFLASIEPIQDCSKDCKRLYETTKVFCRIAKALVESKHTQLGTFNFTDNTLVLPQDQTIFNNFGNIGGPGGLAGGGLGVAGAGAAGLGRSDALPDIFMQDLEGTEWTEGDVEAMSTFFGNWMGSSQPIVDMLNLDFGSCF